MTGRLPLDQEHVREEMRTIAVEALKSGAGKIQTIKKLVDLGADLKQAKDLVDEITGH